MINQIIKRDRTYVPFQKEKIARAIFKAANAVGGDDYARSEQLADQVTAIAEKRYPDGIAEVEGIQDIVEKVLIEAGHAKTAKAYILYREKRRSARESNALIGATINMFTEYLNDQDWRINENANTQKSINGLNNYIREIFTKNYWLHEIYPEEIRNAHVSGEIHIHDLGFFWSVLRGLGFETDSLKRVRRCTRQGGIQTAKAFAFIFRANCQFHIHHTGGKRGGAGMVIV